MEQESKTASLDGIAIVGLTGRFPGAQSVEEFWANLVAARETIHWFNDTELETHDPEFARYRTDPNYIKARGILADADMLDAGFFGFTPREAELTDPQHRLFLECCWEALERAGYNPDQFTGAIGVFGGMSKNTYFLHNLYPHRLDMPLVNTYQAEVGNEKDYLTTRVSYKFNLHGPSLSIHSACSTSLVSIVLACQSLLTYQCDLALAGGVSVRVPQHRGYLYQEGFITSPDGHTRTFDATAKGTVFSNGVGVVVLRRLEDAIADRDQIYAVIKGAALNNDGSLKVSFTAPSVDRQAEVISAAQAVAGFDPETISYVEAHGTATPLGDPIEITALTKAFRLQTNRRQFCAIGSVKTNIGHLDAAAGVTGLIKTTLALHHKLLPASLHFQQPNPELDLENSPFFVNTTSRPWEHSETPRRAGVSSFGVGGTNAHVVLEEAPQLTSGGVSRPYQLLVISACSSTALEHVTQNLAAHLRTLPSENFADVVYTLHVGRKAFEHRRCIVATDATEAVQVLEAPDPKRVVTRTVAERVPPVVFLFPGQGAQHVDMGAELYRHEPLFRALVDQGAELLRPHLGVDLRELLYPSAEKAADAAAQLQQTVITQPALFVIEFALARLWMSWGIQPQVMLGHSVGEYVAATVAGVFTMEDALLLLAERARLMQNQLPGAMLAVRASEEQLQPFLHPGVSLAACNAPTVSVLSGTQEAIDELRQRLDAAGVGARVLHTSHAFHSAMMDSILSAFTERVRSVPRHAPQLRFISSLTGTWITPEQAIDPDYWVQQLRQTVRFSSGVRQLLTAGPQVFLEVGPSRTLSTLVTQHGLAEHHTVIPSLNHAQEQRSDLACLLEATGRLWAAGVAIDWQEFYRHEQRARVLLPTYPFERQRYWIDPPSSTVATPPLHSSAMTTADVPPAMPVSIAPATSVVVAPAATTLSASANGTHTPSPTPTPRRDRILTQLQKLFDDLSGIQIAGETVQHSFIELGLDSLLLTQASGRLQQEFGVRVSFRQLLEDVVSLDALATHLDERLTPEAMPAPTTTAMPSTLSPVVAPRPPTPSASQSAMAAPAKPAGQRFGPFKPVDRARDSGLTSTQQQHLEELMAHFTAKTRRSKEVAQAWRAVLADPRSVAGFRLLWKELVYQLVVERSLGARLWDIDGNEYVDISMCFGANLLGYSPPFVVQAIAEQLQKGIEIGPQSPLTGEVAQLVSDLTGMERVAFCNTGSEAVMAAIRMARTVTGRSKIAYFLGDYHGVFDEVLARPVTRKGTLFAAPIAAGITNESVQNVVVLDYCKPDALEYLERHGHELAAVLVEPIQSRHPYAQPAEFLRQVRTITRNTGTALVFDEVVTGFRVHPGGCQALFDIRADLATYGKIVGGGMPIGVVAGQREFMDALDGGYWNYGDDSLPEADLTFFAGTFVRHPLVLAAAHAVLTHLKQQGPSLQENLGRRTAALVTELNSFLVRSGVPIRVYRFSSLMRFVYPTELTFVNLIFYHMIQKGLYIRDTAQNSFLCTAHTDDDLRFISRVVRESVEEVQAAGFLPEMPEAVQNFPPLPPDVPFQPAPAAADTAPRAVDTLWSIPQAAATAVTPPTTPSVVKPESPFPLTEAQQEIWLAIQIADGATAAYNESVSLHFRGPLQVDRFRDAVHKVIARHPMLLAVFSPDGEWQRIQSEMVIDIAQLDLSRLTAADRKTAIDQLIARDAAYDFDLACGPLLRITVVKLAPEHFQVVWTSHHLVCDGWSTGVLLYEVARIYSAQSRSIAAQLGPVFPFHQYARRAAEQKITTAYQESLSYWRDQFSSIPPTLELPTDRPHPRQRSYRASTVSRVFEASIHQALKRAASQSRTTLTVLLLSALKTLFFRLSGQTDLVVGVTAAGQLLVEDGALVGHCVNLLPIRSQLSGETIFSDYLTTVRRLMLDGYDHQQITYGTLVSQLPLPRVPGRLPLVEVIFNVDRDSSNLEFAGLECSVESNPKQALNFDLFVNFSEGPRGLSVQCHYNTDIFDRSTIERWLAYLEALLKGIAQNPQQSLRALPLPIELQRHQILYEWHQTDPVFSITPLVHQLFETQIESSLDHIAATDSLRSLTYGELNRHANQLASHLSALGVGPDTVVGVYLERPTDASITVLAILKAGGTCLPLDPACPNDHLTFMIEDAAASVVVTTKRLVDLQPIPNNDVRCVFLDENTASLAQESDQNPAPHIDAESLACVLYTSGSRGQLQGVQIPHRTLVNFLLSMQSELGQSQQDILLSVISLSFSTADLEVFLRCGHIQLPALS